MGDNASPFDAIFSQTGLDPNDAVQKSSRPDLPNRFWKDVSLDHREDGYYLLLDGRNACTPSRKALFSANEAVATVLQDEWDAIGDRVDPLKLPMTRLINVARDAQPASQNSLLDGVRAFAETDLVCYRAERPAGLTDRQETVWTPYLDRLKTHHGITLHLASGIMPVTQDPEQLDAIRRLAATRACNMEALVALHLATTLLGSAVLALALTEPGEDDARAKTVWQAAHVDEDWNRAQWGEDEESAALREARWQDFSAAALVLSVFRR